MQKITPHLWFDKEAREAGAFYASVFPNSRVKHTSVLHNTPSGSVDIVTIELSGQEFTLLSAGPLFRFTPAISFLVMCETKEEVDALWQELSRGGSALMELGAYPFSERYGWLQDRYGLSWQVMFAGGQPIRQKITPVLMFTEEKSGKAEEAIAFYTSVFRDAATGDILRYGAGEEPDREGSVKFASFQLEGQDFAAMDSAHPHGFTFNEAISLMVHCDTQQDIDYYWEKLSRDPVGGTMRLAERPIRPVVADRPHRDGRDAGHERSGENRARDRGVSQDEEVRPRGTAARGGGNESLVREAKTLLSAVLLLVLSCGDGESVDIAVPQWTFVRIPPGQFAMGSDSRKAFDQNPRHAVTISRAFEMQATEVTQAQWAAVMGSNPSHFRGVELPVEQVSWNDVQEFLRKLNERDRGKNYRLPTEAEWEYGCRAGTTETRYSEIDEVAWYDANAGERTHRVGEKKPNAWGLYDMLGNVWELCSDWKAPYPSGAVTDPKGPPSGSYKVSRGGGWFDVRQAVTATFRASPEPTYRGRSLGFRLVRDASD